MQKITKNMQDSTQDFKLPVKSYVQNLTNLTQISIDFEFDSDKNSEISCITASSSVHEDADAVI